ncbi:MAG: anthranilate phosphoribosyltransferase [Gammaproteobacteria bacterium]|nr:anthranilate phosphoribosyltransferase [Gammaproteobacteria bacterium]
MPTTLLPQIGNPQLFMREIIERVATGPELSKNLSCEEARRGAQLILDEQVDPVQAGIYLIALRMKRETEDENKGVLQALLDSSSTAQAAVDEVLAIGDPHSGFTRCLPASPFLAPVLASCKLATVSYGVESVGPKFGVTHHKILTAAGVDVDLPLEEAAQRVADPSIGWAYVDQYRYSPKLDNLRTLRNLIVKRSCLTTAEVMIAPLRGRRSTHLITGYVHRAYPTVYGMLSRVAGFESALIVRGVEGGVIPSLQQPSKALRYLEDDKPIEWRLAPTELGIESAYRAVPLPAQLSDEMQTQVRYPQDYVDAMADKAAMLGVAALRGEPGPTRDSLIYGAALCLCHLNRYDSLEAGALFAQQAIDSGDALRRLQQ